jgi:hypothetical protein
MPGYNPATGQWDENYEPGAAPAQTAAAAPAATIKAGSTPPGTVADPNDPTGIRIVDQAAYNAWHASSLAAQKGGAAATAGGLNNATAAGSQDLQADIARRQATSMNGRPAPSTGQFDSGRIDPTAGIQRISAQGGLPTGTAGLTGNLTTSRAPLTTSRPTTTATALGGRAAPSLGIVNPSKTEQAATQASSALGPAPTIDMGVANRQQGNVDAALGLSQQVVNSALQPVDQTGLNRATADARALLDQMLNGPNTAERLGAQTLRTQLALARSARGGPGAVQQALSQAQQQAPELQAQAAQSATNETLARQAAAGNITGQLQTTATQQQANETARINAASNAASGFAQGALGARGQDVQIAQSNQSAASNLLNNVAQLTGVQLELDQRNQELIGQMARDAAAQDFNWAQLSTQQQDAEFDRWVKVYGIDQAAAAQIKAAATANHKGVWDYVVPIIGAAATVAAAGVKKSP